jgi:hypothetical protein
MSSSNNARGELFRENKVRGSRVFEEPCGDAEVYSAEETTGQAAP